MERVFKSEADRQIVSACGVRKPNAGQYERRGAVFRGMGRLLRSRFDGHLSIAALIEDRAARQPQRPSLSFDDQVGSYRAFNTAVNRWAHPLAARHMGRGDACRPSDQPRREGLDAGEIVR